MSGLKLGWARITNVTTHTSRAQCTVHSAQWQLTPPGLFSSHSHHNQYHQYHKHHYQQCHNQYHQYHNQHHQYHKHHYHQYMGQLHQYHQYDIIITISNTPAPSNYHQHHQHRHCNRHQGHHVHQVHPNPLFFFASVDGEILCNSFWWASHGLSSWQWLVFELRWMGGWEGGRGGADHLAASLPFHPGAGFLCSTVNISECHCFWIWINPAEDVDLKCGSWSPYTSTVIDNGYMGIC